MKVTIFLLLTVILGSTAAVSYSQSAKLTLDLKNSTIKEILNHIEDQSEFRFFYSGSVDVERQTSIMLKNEKIFDVLDELFEGTDVKYEVRGRQIALVKGNDPILFEGVQVTQQRTVSGSVTDEYGEPLPGVTIMIKGTMQGTITNADGKYLLANIPDGATLVFSFVGMITKEVEVKSQTSVDVKMEMDAIGIEEVVAVGYGTQQKGELTVAIAQVKAEELKDIPVSSIDQALTGRVAGVSVVQGSGGPGAGTSIRIRGSNSINSSSEPLYVIDGLPIATSSSDNSASSRFGFTGDQINVLASINPNDIESIDILKDAAATSIYGARGANGVILITTKKGQAGKSAVSFTGYYGVQQISKSMEMLNSTELSQLIYEARTNSGVTITDNPDLLARKMAIPDTYDTDWLSLVSRIAPIQDYNVNLNGGSNAGKYSLSMGYFAQDGVIRATDLQRYSARLNLESSALNDHLKLGANISASRTESQMINTEYIYSTALLSAPNLPVYDEEGYYTYNVPENFFNDEYSYPTILFDLRGYTRVPMYNIEMVRAPKLNDKVFGNAFLEIKLFGKLTYRLNAGLDVNHNKIKYFSPEFGEMRYGQGAANDLSHVMNNTYTLENTLSYVDSFGKHNVTALLGQSAQKYTYERVGFTASNLDNFYTFWGNPDNMWALDGDNFNTGGKYSAFSDWKFSSYFGRLNYNYDDKYLLTATVRMDGSSKFGANSKWGTFPGFSAAWILSNENFFRRSNSIDMLKIRLGYGVTGNSNISNYLSLFVMSNIGAPIGGYYVPAFTPRRLVDKDLSWESTGQLNVGIDVAMLNRRLSSTIDFYTKDTWDMIDALEVSQASGFGNIAATNIGELRGTGIEFSVEYDFIQSGNLTWNTRVVASHETTKITKLADEKKYFGNSNGDIRSYLNKPIGEFYGFEVLGLFQQGEDIASSAQPQASPGDYKYLDWNGYDENGEFTNQPDGLLNDADRKALGNALPDLSFSLTNTIKFKNFDFTAYLNGVSGITVYNQARWTYLSLNGVWNNSKEALMRWTPDKTNTTIQRAAESRLNGKDNQLNSEFIEDASYLRISNLTLGYTFRPQGESVLKNFRIYASAHNLLTITNYSGVDPEVSGSGLVNRGIDNGRYPKTKTYLVGLNINF